MKKMLFKLQLNRVFFFIYCINSYFYVLLIFNQKAKQKFPKKQREGKYRSQCTLLHSLLLSHLLSILHSDPQPARVQHIPLPPLILLLLLLLFTLSLLILQKHDQGDSLLALPFEPLLKPVISLPLLLSNKLKERRKIKKGRNA